MRNYTLYLHCFSWLNSLRTKPPKKKHGSKRRTKKKTEPYSKQGRVSSQKTRTKTIRRLNRRMKIRAAMTMRSKAHRGSRMRPPKNPHLLARTLSRQTACLLVLHPLEERQKPLSFLPRLRLRRTRSPRLYVPLKSLLESGSFSPAPEHLVQQAQRSQLSPQSHPSSKQHKTHDH